MKNIVQSVLAVMFFAALANIGLGQTCAKLSVLSQDFESGFGAWQNSSVNITNAFPNGNPTQNCNYTWAGGNAGVGWATQNWCIGSSNSPFSSGSGAAYSELACSASGHKEHVLTSPAVDFTGGCDPSLPAPTLDFTYAYLPSALQAQYGTVEMNIEITPDITDPTPKWFVIASYTDMNAMATGQAYSSTDPNFPEQNTCSTNIGSFDIGRPTASQWQRISVPFPQNFGIARNAAVRFRVFNDGGSSGSCWFPIWIDDISMNGSFNQDLAVKTIGTFINGVGQVVNDSAVIAPTATFQTTMSAVQVGSVSPASTGNTAKVYYQIYGLNRPLSPLYSDSATLSPLPSVQCGDPTTISFKTLNPSITQAPGEYTVRTIVTVNNGWDCNHSNDTLTADLVVGYENDVKPLRMITPGSIRQAEIVGLTQNPQVMIRNIGLKSAQGFHVSLDIFAPDNTWVYRADAVETNNLASGAIDYLSFAQFNATTNGMFKFRVITNLGSDLNRLNDTLVETRQFYWKYDVRADSIVVPLNAITHLPEVPQGGSYRPVGLFDNNGASFVANVPVTFEAWKLPITGGALPEFSATDNMPEINIEDGMRKIAFYAGPGSLNIWSPQQIGDYELKMYCRYPGDGDHRNDTVILFVTSIARMLGTYRVGFGQSIASLQAAVDSLNYRGVRGNVVFQLVDNSYTQTTDLVFQKVRYSNGASARITFKPAAGIVPIIALNNGSRIVWDFATSNVGVDGSNSTGATPNRALTIIQSTPGTPAFFLSRGASNNLIQNCAIQTAQVTGQSPAKLNQRSIGIWIKNQYPNYPNDTLACSGNDINNNDIEGFRTAVWAQGLAPVFVAGTAKYTFHYDSNNVVRNNVMKNLGRAGVLGVNQYGMKVYANDISLIENSSVNVCAQMDEDANVVGIGLGGVRTMCSAPFDNLTGAAIPAAYLDSAKGYVVESQVFGNKIHDINSANMSSAATPTRAVGIEVIQDTVWANAKGAPYTFQTPGIHPVITHNVVWNNMIWNLDTATANGEAIGILFDARGLSDATIPSANTFFSVGDSVVNNSILLRGSVLSRTSAIDLGHAYKPMVWNNILENDATAGTRSLITYAIQRPESGLDADHNLYWFGAVGTANSALVRLQILDANGNFREQKTYGTMEQWQSGSSNDQHSFFANPQFKSSVFPVNLHIKNIDDGVWSPAYQNGGLLFGTAVTKDIDNEQRGIGGTAYDIGADEFSGKQFPNDIDVLRIANPTSSGSVQMVTNPFHVQAIVQNTGNSTQLRKKIYLTISNVAGGAPHRDTIQSDFKINETKTLTFGVSPQWASYQNPFQAANGARYVIQVAADPDNNTVNDTISTTVTFFTQHHAICVSYNSATQNGRDDRDSVIDALNRWGFTYDLFDRNILSPARREGISYAPWPTLVYCAEDSAGVKPPAAGGATYNYALSYDERQQLSTFLNLGVPNLRRSLVMAGKDIASYHDINPDETVRDTFFTRQLLHEIYVNAPTLAPYNGKLNGVRIEPGMREQIVSGNGDAVDDVQPVAVKNGATEYAYSYNTRSNIAAGLDTAAGVTFWGQQGVVNYNIITYGFDWRQLSRVANDTSSGIARVILNSLDFIEKNGGCIVPCKSLPVELMSFDAKLVKRDVAVSWETAVELNVSEFDVERKAAGTAAWNIVAHGSVSARGVNGGGARYSLVDPSIPPGVYVYRLAYVHNDGHTEYSSTRQVVVPAAYVLYQNYPNPFNPTTQIDYVTMEQGHVKLSLYDVVGNVVCVLVDDAQDAGSHGITVDASALSSGVYSYRLEVNGFTQTRRMMLMK